MDAVDTSVAIAGLTEWHERHEVGHSALAARPSIPAHALLETYSVLTRLPAPYRLEAALVADLLSRAFGKDARLAPGKKLELGAAEIFAGLGVSGGASYDALIGLTAKDHGAVVLTLDERALATYRRCGAEATLLEAR